MGKKKDLVAKENELFENSKEEVKMEEIKNEGQEVENKDAAENQEVVENKGTDTEPEMEMEMELDSEEVQGEMEELVAEKVEKEAKENKEQKSKRGPKPGEKAEKEEDKKPEEKKEKALNLKDSNIVQREIKKGRLAAPQGRIEKTEAGDYVMKLADGVIFPQDAKGNLKEVGKIAKMNDGKYVLTKTAADNLKTDKFTAKHENGEEVEHDWVRVELHKPGREKDVVELFTVKEAKNYLNVQDAKDKKKEEEAKKKAEKAEKEKAEKEAADKKDKEEATA